MDRGSERRLSTAEPRKPLLRKNPSWCVFLRITTWAQLINQYALDEGNPLASVTHERDLDEFLANAALADTDFMTGQLVTLSDCRAEADGQKGRSRGSSCKLRAQIGQPKTHSC